MNDFLVVILSAGLFSAWLTHIITCLQDGSWGYLIAGALLIPIGILHGFGIWIGIF